MQGASDSQPGQLRLAVCSVFACVCLLLATVTAAEGAPEPLLLLCPLLLLLSQDPILLRHLGERQRYLPPVLAFSGYLAITSAIQVSHMYTGIYLAMVLLWVAVSQGGSEQRHVRPVAAVNIICCFVVLQARFESGGTCAACYGVSVILQ